jgi:hypothetical protein
MLVHAYATLPGNVRWSGPHHNIKMLHFLLFHSVTCYTNSIASPIHVNTTRTLWYHVHFGCHRFDTTEFECKIEAPIVGTLSTKIPYLTNMNHPTIYWCCPRGRDQCCTGICPAHGSVKGYVHWFVIPAWTSGSYAHTRFIPGHWMCLPTLNLVINPYLAQRWAWKPLNMHVFVHYDCFRRCTGLLCAQLTTGSGSY